MKYKILNLVRRLLRIPEVAPFIEQEQHKVEIVRAGYTVDEQEYRQLSQDQLEYAIGTCIMEEIIKNKLITIEINKGQHDQYRDGNKFVEISAFIKVVNPKRL